MECPRCQSSLVLGERNGVEIDYCQSCRGIWLDAGEIDKIIDRSSTATNMERQNQPQNYDQGRDNESWWERLLDIFD